MKDQEEKKKRTPKRKEKRKKSVICNATNSENPAVSPYGEKQYKEEKEPVKRRQLHKLSSQQTLTKQNGVFVDTLFPSEHLVAMSIATCEQDNSPATPEQLISLQDELAPHDTVADYALAMKDQILVMDPDTKQKVATKCISTRENAVFVGPTGDEPKPTDPYVLSRCLIQKRFGSGVLLIRPMEMKPTQLVTRGDLIFQLWYGRVSITIHETTSVTVSGDFFFIPRGNTYSIRNLRNEEAKFSYTVVKEIDEENEAEDKTKVEKQSRGRRDGDGKITRQDTFITDTPASHPPLPHLTLPVVGDERSSQNTVLSPRRGPSLATNGELSERAVSHLERVDETQEQDAT